MFSKLSKTYSYDSFAFSGDKSEVLDIDNPDLNKFPDFARASRYECYLEPGDILYIPGKADLADPFHKDRQQR